MSPKVSCAHRWGLWKVTGSWGTILIRGLVLLIHGWQLLVTWGGEACATEEGHWGSWRVHLPLYAFDLILFSVWHTISSSLPCPMPWCPALGASKLTDWNLYKLWAKVILSFSLRTRWGHGKSQGLFQMLRVALSRRPAKKSLSPVNAKDWNRTVTQMSLGAYSFLELSG